MKFFKPEDLDADSAFLSSDIKVWLAAKLNNKLEREGKIVYKGPTGRGPTFTKEEIWTTEHREDLSHKAILVAIEPIEKCLHEKEKVTYVMLNEAHDYIKCFKCECGAKVIPTQFSEDVK